MAFYVYNTLKRKKEELIPIKEGYIGMYTCGPTVYNYAHIGNLRTYIFEDLLKKSLEYSGFRVKHVMNITDVGHLQSDSDEGEDKMEIGAKRENKTAWEIAKFYEDAFFEDCTKLNIQRPTITARATDHIEDMINLIMVLEKNGYTYNANGNVYFEIDKFKNYNKLANLSMKELEAGSRIKVDPHKRNPLDFVLWFTNSKFKNQIMQWDSPWGIGFPGWHLECSAMSLKYLGETIDIHCGGVDHIPVHHTNEIAQSEAAIGHKCVNYWLHGEFLVLDGGKMSKSSEDFLTLSKLIDEGFSPMDYRYFCLNSRYRKQLVFSFESLKDAQSSLKKLKSRIISISEGLNDNDIVDLNKLLVYKNKFLKEIGNDLNIANALTVMFDVIKNSELNNSEKLSLIQDYDKVFSLNLLHDDVEEKIHDSTKEIVEKLIQDRTEAREKKDWVKADEIRKKLIGLNIEITDTKEGTTWKKQQLKTYLEELP